MHNKDSDHLTLYSAVSPGSAWPLPSFSHNLHASGPAISPIPCDHYFPPPFSLLHSTSTQIFTHAHPDKNIFILTHTLCSGQGSHTHIHAHFLIYTHAFAHVMFGSPWDPDEWNLSVGSRYTEHHRGSLSSQKSTKPQSRSTVPSHAHTWPCTHMCLDLFTHTPATHREVEEKWNKETEGLTWTESDRSSQKCFKLQRQDRSWTVCRTHTTSSCLPYKKEII